MGYLPQIPTTSSSLRTELIGTFLLVLIGTSALTALNVAGQATTASAVLVGTIAFAATIGWLTYVFYRFPLPQFNPAITLLFWVQNLQPLGRSLMILSMQMLGAVAASVVVALLYGSAGVEVRLGAPYPATLMGSWAAVAAEYMGTLVVLYTIQIAMNRQRLAFFNPFLLIGLGYALGYLLSTGISGGSLNPARALAPQLAAADLTGWWAYIVGPFAAAATIGIFSRSSKETQPELTQTATEGQAQASQLPITPAVAKVISTTSKPKPVQSEPVAESTTEEMQTEQILQQKAQAAITRLKQEPERPRLPFALAKPSFYPLAASKDEPTRREAGQSNSVAQSLPSEPSIAPIVPTPTIKSQPTQKPAVKFVDYSHQTFDEGEE